MKEKLILICNKKIIQEVDEPDFSVYEADNVKIGNRQYYIDEITTTYDITNNVREKYVFLVEFTNASTFCVRTKRK